MAAALALVSGLRPPFDPLAGEIRSSLDLLAVSFIDIDFKYTISGEICLPLNLSGASAIDLAVTIGAITFYYRQFGLKMTNEQIVSLLAKCLFPDFAVKITYGEAVHKYCSVVGRVIAGSRSFIITLLYLTSFIDELEKEAMAVWDNAAKQSIQDSS